MVMRGVKKLGSKTVTSKMLGCFNDDSDKRKEFYALLNASA
jgi:GTP cyclohydrolase I